jgi:pimeloyl-ACP methyl ester carboxylesterase
MKNRDDCVAWLSEVLDGLDLPRATLVGMSFGGCLSLNFALRVPGRVDRLVLLSPGGSFSAVRPRFYLGVVPTMVIPFLPKRFLEHGWRRSMLYEDNLRDPQTRAVNEHMLEQAYLGLRYFRRRLMWENYTQNQPLVLPDDELRSIEVPTLLLIGQQETAYDAAAALQRAKRLVPNLEGELIPRASHDMSVGQHDIVDKRILDFLEPTEQPG